METKTFPTAQVLSVVTGRLLGGIDGVYEILEWMTGGAIFTHQIPGVSDEATPAILRLHPDLSEALKESTQVNRTNWSDWLGIWVDRYGPEITVPKLIEYQP